MAGMSLGLGLRLEIQDQQCRRCGEAYASAHGAGCQACAFEADSLAALRGLALVRRLDEIETERNARRRKNLGR